VEGRGIPLVEVHCRFMQPSHLSDRLRFLLRVTRLGRRSITLNLRAFGDDGQRLEADMTVVYASRDSGRAASREIPPELAQKIREFLVTDAAN
ncbi:MAG: hypothetical protein HYY36_02395, partial [Gammaproteobacteria bacterium]|nr:hypothetical protein [Gammaproteobacteria bacterium]